MKSSVFDEDKLERINRRAQRDRLVNNITKRKHHVIEQLNTVRRDASVTNLRGITFKEKSQRSQNSRTSKRTSSPSKKLRTSRYTVSTSKRKQIRSQRHKHASSHHALLERYNSQKQIRSPRGALKSNRMIKKLSKGNTLEFKLSNKTARADSSLNKLKQAFLTEINSYEEGDDQDEGGMTSLGRLPALINSSRSVKRMSPTTRARIDAGRIIDRILDQCDLIEQELRNMDEAEDFDLVEIKKKIGFDEVIRKQKEQDADQVSKTLKIMLYEDIERLNINRKIVLQNVQDHSKAQSKFITTKLIEDPQLEYRDKTLTLTTETIVKE